METSCNTDAGSTHVYLKGKRRRMAHAHVYRRVGHGNAAVYRYGQWHVLRRSMPVGHYRLAPSCGWYKCPGAGIGKTS
ncbi:MAG: hypothetical protein AB7V43_13140 [Acidimicrobiia bacterium]